MSDERTLVHDMLDHINPVCLYRRLEVGFGAL
jgi:hypothetical protein